MENKRKIPKRIFSLFLAILCTFGIFFVSYIPSYAQTYYFESISFPGSSYYFPSTSFTSDVSSGTVGSRTFSVSSHTQPVYYVGIINDNERGYDGPLFFSSAPFTLSGYADLTSSSFNSNDLVVYYSARYWLRNDSVSPSPVVHVDATDYIHDSYFREYAWLMLNSVINATPEPTSTPEPTPTPNPYGPGPVPTIPPGEASYTSFFNRLASDAQNAFNAIFLSWQNANNKFYSGLFFIGFPVLLGIIGLVASIFFGDDD